jgi:single-strand DNA-binding protein
MELTVISGNVGKKPEMRYTPQGQPVTSFSVAVNRQWTGGDGEVKKETKWFRVSTWGKLAENCNAYVVKGMKVIIQGWLTCDPQTGGPRIWNRQDGTAGATFELTAYSVEFGPTPTEGGASNGHNEPHDMGELPPEDDIPF